MAGGDGADLAGGDGAGPDLGGTGVGSSPGAHLGGAGGASFSKRFCLACSKASLVRLEGVLSDSLGEDVGECLALASTFGVDGLGL